MTDTRNYPSESVTENLITQIQGLGGTPTSYGLGELQRLLADLQGGGEDGGANDEQTIRAQQPNQLAPLGGPIAAQGNIVASNAGAATQNGEPIVWGQSGTLVGARTIFEGSSYTKIPSASTSLAVVDTTNLHVSLVAPPSGNVLIEADLPAVGFVGGATLGQFLFFSLVTHGTTTQVSEWVLGYSMAVAGSGSNIYSAPLHRYMLVLGLTSGTSYEFDLAWASSSANGTQFLGSNHSVSSGSPATGSLILSPYAA